MTARRTPRRRLGVPVVREAPRTQESDGLGELAETLEGLRTHIERTMERIAERSCREERRRKDAKAAETELAAISREMQAVPSLTRETVRRWSELIDRCRQRLRPEMD